MSALPEQRGLIAWFARNPVAANLLMLLIICAGLFSLYAIRKEAVPPIEPRMIEIGVAYPGAAPEEVEDGVIARIEEALEDIDGIDEVRAWAFEGYGDVNVMLRTDTDISRAMDEVKIAIDAISTFPEEIERPQVRREVFRAQVMKIQFWGDVDEATLTRLADEARDDLARVPGVAAVNLLGARDFEIAIEVREETLRRYGLTLNAVAAAIRASSLDLPGGAIRTESGDVRLRTKGQAYTAADFERIVLRTNPDGTRLTVGDVADVRDGFAETWFYSFFDGRRSIGLDVSTSRTGSEIAVGKRLREWVVQRQQELPDGVYVDYWGDASYYLGERLGMMLENLALGSLLVFALLGLFLRPQVALWVIIGIPVAFLGALALMPAFDLSINLFSLFALVLVLGIVVDDAIVIGESAYAEMERSGSGRDAVVRGAQRVAVPATFGVLTTIAAFAPMTLITGAPERIAASVGWVVILALVFSLVESKLILPAHLSHVRARKRGTGWLTRVQDACANGLTRFVHTHYRPFLETCVAHRWTTLSVFVGMLAVSIGFAFGGQLRYVFFPPMANDFVFANIELSEGAPEELGVQVLSMLQDELATLNEALAGENDGTDVVRHSATFLFGGSNGRVVVELHHDVSERFSPEDVAARWREQVGEIAGLQKMEITASQFSGGGPPLSFRLFGRDPEQLEAASKELTAYLRSFAGVYEVESSNSSATRELQLEIRPEAEALGLTLGDLARQVREAFYGAEAQRIQRGTNEIKVMVRYPESERRSLGDLEDMWIRTPDGTEVPFTSVARAVYDDAPSRIRRFDRRRAVNVMGNVDIETVDPGDIVRSVSEDYLPDLESRYPGVESALSGATEEEEETLRLIAAGAALALLVIYALMAVPLGSYSQPLVIMSVIPFGVIGAIMGHLALGLAASMVSMLGCIALAGVVVNDSLIMVDFVNSAVREGRPRAQAAVEAGAKRFRAILLTSMTTFFGLVPMMMETSGTASFMKPMAVSLAFGILFATVITLILVPCLYVILDDVELAMRRMGRRLVGTPERTA